MKAEIGKRLKGLRVERGLTQKELASRVKGGIDYTYIGKIERGEQLPSLKILIEISDALSVPVSHFFHDERMAAMAEISSSGSISFLLQTEPGRKLLKALTKVHTDDIPLVVEIINVLSRHRMDTRNMQYEISNETYLKAAEEQAAYGKKPGTNKSKKKSA